MMGEYKQELPLPFYLAGAVPVIWAALLTAPLLPGNLMDIAAGLKDSMKHPLQFIWCEGSLKTIFLFLSAYVIGIGIYYATKRNYRKGEEHGSAKWGSPKELGKKYADHDYCSNKILTRNVRISFQVRKHRRNLNIVVIGGAGSGKTRFFGKPNVMSANCSMVILDPKGGARRSSLKRTGTSQLNHCLL